MRRLFSPVAFLLLAASLQAQTADEIVAKYLEARGGAEKIKAVQSERVSGTIAFGADIRGPFVVERKRPLKMHMEFIVNGQTLIRTYDGKSAGWTYNPFMPNPAVQAMGAEELRNIFDEADFDGPFVDYKAKGNKLEIVDKEEVTGKTAYKVKLTNKLGDVSSFYFDAATHLLLKWEGERKVGDKSVPWESFFRDYRDQGGLKYPFLVESDSPGTDQTQTISADKIEVNIPIDDARFGKPHPATPPPAAADAPADAAKPN
jgi:hypothetical protein